MKKIFFTSNFDKYPKDSFIAKISSVNSQSTLFDSLKDSLMFPYFGYNWDALIDLYRDFDWIDSVDIYILHKGIRDLPKEDLLNYLDVIDICIAFWRKYTEHNVYFYFDEKEKKIIESCWREKIQLYGIRDEL